MIFLFLTFLGGSTLSEEIMYFDLSTKELSQIKEIINKSVRGKNWNDEIESVTSYYFEQPTANLERIVNVEFAPHTQDSSIRKKYHVDCFSEVESDTWECIKFESRSIFSKELSGWIPFLSDDISDSEATSLLQSLTSQQFVFYPEKNMQFKLEELDKFGIAKSSMTHTISLHMSNHKILGPSSIELKQKDDKWVVVGIIQFFKLCSNNEMLYGPEECP